MFSVWRLLLAQLANAALLTIASGASTADREARAEPSEQRRMPDSEEDSFWLGFVSSMSRSSNPWSMGTTEVEATGAKLHDAVVKPMSTAFVETGAKILVASVAVIVALSFCAFLVKRCYGSVLTSVLSTPSPQTSQSTSRSNSEKSQPPPIPPKPRLMALLPPRPVPVEV